MENHSSPTERASIMQIRNKPRDLKVRARETSRFLMCGRALNQEFGNITNTNNLHIRKPSVAESIDR